MCANKLDSNLAHVKTNAMRILDREKITYTTYLYDGSDGKIDGIAVAEKIGKSPELLYKTLVTRGASRTIYVFIICVEDELDLKKAAKAAGEKNIEMVQVKELLGLTGYVRGGCSPVGMKKSYNTYIDKRVNVEMPCTSIDAIQAEHQHLIRQALSDTMIISGGKIGVQLEIKKDKLLEVTKAVVYDLCK